MDSHGHLHFFPDSFLDSALVSTGIGILFSQFILVTQGWIVEKLSNYHEIYLQITWKICIYLTSISTISFWRGAWMLMDRFAGDTLTIFLVSHSIAFVFLTITRTTCSVVACPGYLLKDEKASPSTSFNFDVAPLLIRYIKNKSIQIFVSHFLTIFIISTAIVCYWRGTWNLGIYLANISVGTGLYNCVARITFGYVVSLVCFLISHPLQRTLTGDFLLWPYKIFLEHVFIYVLGFAAVNVWSGLWCLGDHCFIIPGQKDNQSSALLRHCVSAIVLYMAQGAINLVSAPVACRTHSPNVLEGLFMGTYFIFAEQNVTGRPIEVTSTNNASHNENTQTELNMNDSDNNARHRENTQTELNMNDSDNNASHNENTQTELNMDDSDNNASHNENTQTELNINDKAQRN